MILHFNLYRGILIKGEHLKAAVEL